MNNGDLVRARDLADWLGEAITDEADVKRANRVISYALTLVNEEIDRSNEYWREQGGIPETVSNVVLQVAGRGYTNPESWGNERLDDWGGGARPIEELGMYLTATEKRLVSRYAPRKLLGVGVLDTYRDSDTETAVAPWFDPVTGGIPDWRQQ